MAKSIKLKNDNYWDSSSIVHEQENLSTLLKMLPSERGRVYGNQMSRDTNLNQAYINIKFSKTYKNVPSVIIGNGTATSSRGFWGNIPVYARSITNTGFVLTTGYAYIDGSFTADYLVFSND